MKGFVEVTNELGTKHLINIRHIEEVMNSTIYLDVVNPDCDEQDHIFCEESYEEIKAKIAEAVGEMPAADVVDYETVAEMLRNMFNDDCACNYNGYDEWLPTKCKYAGTDCPMPKERLGCWKEFVKYFFEKLHTQKGSVTDTNVGSKSEKGGAEE